VHVTAPGGTVVSWFARDSLIENNREQNGATKRVGYCTGILPACVTERIGVDFLAIHFVYLSIVLEMGGDSPT
jgi:hypothetical protein